MSTTTVVPSIRPRPPGREVPEPYGPFFLNWLTVLLDWRERRRQRQALAELADDARLLADIGLTREQALDEAALPFWLASNFKAGGDQWPNR